MPPSFGAELARRELALLVPILDLGQDPAPDPLAGDVADRALLIGQQVLEIEQVGGVGRRVGSTHGSTVAPGPRGGAAPPAAVPHSMPWMPRRPSPSCSSGASPTRRSAWVPPPSRRPAARSWSGTRSTPRRRNRASRTSPAWWCSAAPSTSSTPTSSRSSRRCASSRARPSTPGSRTWASASARRCWRGRSTPRSTKAPVREIGFEPIRPLATAAERPSAGPLRTAATTSSSGTWTRSPCPTVRSCSSPGTASHHQAYPRRRPHLGRAVPLRDRPGGDRDVAHRVRGRPKTSRSPGASPRTPSERRPIGISPSIKTKAGACSSDSRSSRTP